MAAETWQMRDPWRLHPDHLVVDDDSAEALQTAVQLLELARSPLNQGDGALRVHVLASLIAQAEALLSDAQKSRFRTVRTPSFVVNGPRRDSWVPSGA